MNGSRTKLLQQEMRIQHPIHSPLQWRLKKQQYQQSQRPRKNLARNVSKKRHLSESREKFQDRREQSNKRRREREKKR